MQKRTAQALLVGGLMVMAGAANAALPTEAAAAFTTLSGNVTDILTEIWKIVPVAVGGFVLVKLFKKGANRAV